MTSLFEVLTDFFDSIFKDSNTFDYLNNIAFKVGDTYSDGVITPYYMAMNEWLIYTCSLISTIIIVVICSLFVYKIVRLIGGLIR